MFVATLFIILLMQCCRIVEPASASQQQASQAPVPGRPQFDTKPLYSHSYLAASMQVIAHISDLMKFDLGAVYRPQKPTMKPLMVTSPMPETTSHHKPGIYAPSSRNDKIGNYETNHLTNNLIYLAENPRRILQQINRFNEDEDFDYSNDNDFNLEIFAKNYDDDVNDEFLRLPKNPPTGAYVTLLGLYDVLNKEAKRIGLNRYNGYTNKLLEELIEHSSGSAYDQLKFVLTKMIAAQDSPTSEVVVKTKKVLAEMDKADGTIANAIRYYPPLSFAE